MQSTILKYFVKKKGARLKSIVICIAAMCEVLVSQNLNFSTVEFAANITAIATLNAEVASVLDDNNRTHIAWIDEKDNSSKLMYSVYNNVSVATVEIPVPGALTNELKICPSIVLDKNHYPHITYFVKRDRNGGIQTGNYAVMYAGDPEGDGSFEVSQISTNSTVATDNTSNIYNAWVNGRPQIVMDGDQIVIAYVSASSNLTNYKNYYLFAHKSGSSWVRSQELNASDNNPPTADDGVSLGQRLTVIQYMVWNDISTYNPRYAWKNGGVFSSILIPGYGGGLGAVKHTQLEIDDNNAVHFIWFSNTKKKFCHTILNSSAFSPIDEDSSLNQYSTNFYPATVDLKTGKPVYAYYKNPQYNVIVFTEDGKRIETEITQKGVVYGKRSLNVRNGFISFVTASQANKKIYITTNYGTTVVERSFANAPEDYILQQNFPNPFNPTTTIFYGLPYESTVRITVYNLLGQEVNEIVNEHQSAGWKQYQWIAAVPSGIYFYKIEANSSEHNTTYVDVKKMLIVK